MYFAGRHGYKPSERPCLLRKGGVVHRASQYWSSPLRRDSEALMAEDRLGKLHWEFSVILSSLWRSLQMGC